MLCFFFFQQNSMSVDVLVTLTVLVAEREACQSVGSSVLFPLSCVFTHAPFFCSVFSFWEGVKEVVKSGTCGRGQRQDPMGLQCAAGVMDVDHFPHWALMNTLLSR